MKRHPPISRRDFLKLTATAAAAAAVAGCSATPLLSTPTATALPANTSTQSPTSTNANVAAGTPQPEASSTQPGPTDTSTPEPSPTSAPPYLAVAHGPDPAAITRAAIETLGGMAAFVSPGYEVVIKPNICTDYHPPEYASTTNPIVVATLVTMCLEAGAKRVQVFDYPFGGTPKSAYEISGIEEAVKSAGGEMPVMTYGKYAKFDIPAGRDITSIDIYRDILETDLVIDVPIAKHHSATRLTLAEKNLMGVILNRNMMHVNLGQRIADLTSLVRPGLTVVDAVRILTNHGPTGGDLADVKQTDTVIASRDIVAADAYATTLFGLTGADIAYIQASADMGLGTMDLSSINIQEVNVG